MNDCFYSFIGCEDVCGECEYYLSVNSEKGESLLTCYQEEINEAIKPIQTKWLCYKGEDAE